MKTLVIHPFDPSTEFLREIYAHIDCTVIRNRPKSKSNLHKQMSEHDRIIMLGHGIPHGLLNVSWKNWGAFIVGKSELPYLREKTTFISGVMPVISYLTGI